MFFYPRSLLIIYVLHCSVVLTLTIMTTFSYSMTSLV